MNFDRHFYLYAKGHYKIKKNDTMRVLQILVAERCGLDIEYVDIKNITNILFGLAVVYLKDARTIGEFVYDLLPSNWWKYGPRAVTTTVTENSMIEALCFKCLSVLRLQTVADIPFELGSADAGIQKLLNTESK